MSRTVPESQDFAKMLAAARAGSREALGELLQACRRYLLRVAEEKIEDALKIKGSPSDLVQDTFLDAQKGFGRFQGYSERELLAWLVRILRNNLRNFSRDYQDVEKRQVEGEVRLDDSAAQGNLKKRLVSPARTPSSMAIREEEAHRFRRAVQRLPEQYRLVIRLRDLERRSFEEIGPLVNTSAEGARKMWHRALRQLANGLKR
ncbi:MAG TPA: sigma-70 family RNA polymerase sigma factor [Gemmataceae bacterium]|nr:sigma-70 family RNA polymerase sigma factor [Gemmataceae bacterium]